MKPVRNDNAVADEFDPDRIDALPTFDPAEYLTSDEAIAAYINEFLEEGNTEIIAEAIAVAARAKGLADGTREHAVAREKLANALRQEKLPQLETVLRVMKALDLKLVATPARQAPPTPAK